MPADVTINVTANTADAEQKLRKVGDQLKGAAQGAGLFPAAVGQGDVGHAADLVLDVPDRFAVAGEVDVLHGWYLHFKKPGSALPGLIQIYSL